MNYYEEKKNMYKILWEGGQGVGVQSIAEIGPPPLISTLCTYRSSAHFYHPQNIAIFLFLRVLPCFEV